MKLHIRNYIKRITAVAIGKKLAMNVSQTPHQENSSCEKAIGKMLAMKVPIRNHIIEIEL